MTNNPEKISALRNFGFELVERVTLPIRFHRTSERYLKTKRERMGHFINFTEGNYGHAAN